MAPAGARSAGPRPALPKGVERKPNSAPSGRALLRSQRSPGVPYPFEPTHLVPWVWVHGHRGWLSGPLGRDQSVGVGRAAAVARESMRGG